MAKGFSTDTKEFERAMGQLGNASVGTDREILTVGGREMMFNVVAATPKATGKARAGWWPAWRGLGRSGNPLTRRREGRTKIKGRVYISEGAFEDGRDKRGEAFIEISKSTHIVSKRGKENYLFITDAVGAAKGWMARGVAKTTGFFENLTLERYERLLAKFGTR